MIAGFHLLFAAEGIELSVAARGWFPPGLPTRRTSWRFFTRKLPTRLRRREAIFTRPGMPWSRSTRGALISSARSREAGGEA